MFIKKSVLALLLISVAATAPASMTISGTRIIFPGSDKEVSVRTNNKGANPSLVQVWIDDGSTTGNVNDMKVPFITTPPVYRVEPNRGQTVRVIYNGMALPQDRESLYWFNLLEIPPAQKAESDNKNKLELAFRTRIKLIYRPSSLGYSGADKLEDVTWEIVDNPKFGRGIKISNPTAYYMNFDGGKVQSNGSSWDIDLDMVAPLESKEFYAKPAMPSGNTISGAEIRILSDYGAPLTRQLNISGGNVLTLNKEIKK